MPAVFRSPLFLVLALWFAGLGAAAQFAKIAVILPELQAFYGRDGAESGLLVSLISFMGVVLGIVAGIAAIRIGLRRLLIAALVLGAAVSLWQAAMPSFSVMLASRILEGLSHLAVVVTAPTLIARIAPPHRQGTALTLWGTFFSVAFAVTGLVAPAIIAAHGIGALFAAHGLYMAAFAALLAVTLPQVSHDRNEGKWPTPGDIARRHAAVYSSPFIAAPAAGWLFYTMTFVSLLTLLPPLFEASVRPLATAAMPLAAIASSMLIGSALLRRMRAISVVLIGFSAAIVLSAGLLVAPGSLGIAVALFAALGLVQGASFATVPQLNDGLAEQALSNAGIAQMGNLGNMLGTPVAIAILSTIGYQGLPVFLIVCYGAAIALHVLLARRRATNPATT
ncbi:MAG: MFS transporter [Brucellaceae bacterium]|nr:MFS transporter [Brucellaceae bacterium]